MCELRILQIKAKACVKTGYLSIVVTLKRGRERRKRERML